MTRMCVMSSLARFLILAVIGLLQWKRDCEAQLRQGQLQDKDYTFKIMLLCDQQAKGRLWKIVSVQG